MGGRGASQSAREFGGSGEWVGTIKCGGLVGLQSYLVEGGDKGLKIAQARLGVR